MVFDTDTVQLYIIGSAWQNMDHVQDLQLNFPSFHECVVLSKDLGKCYCESEKHIYPQNKMFLVMIV